MSSLAQPQAMTTDAFTTGEIYATAFVSSNSHGFHYTLSIMKDQRTCTKYHAKEVSTRNFVFEIVENKILNTSKTLCVAVKIGKLQDQSPEMIKQLLEKIPMILPDCDKEIDGYFRCRVWLKKAIRALDNEGIIFCSKADAVVNGELMKYAKDNSEAITLGHGGAKVYVSQYSK